MEGGGGGGESPNGVVIDDPMGLRGEDYYDFDAELNDVVCALCGDGGELLWCFVVTTKHAAASTTLRALVRSFTTVILQRLADAVFGLLPVGRFGAEDHIDHARPGGIFNW